MRFRWATLACRQRLCLSTPFVVACNHRAREQSRPTDAWTPSCHQSEAHLQLRQCSPLNVGARQLAIVERGAQMVRQRGSQPQEIHWTRRKLREDRDCDGSDDVSGETACRTERRARHRCRLLSLDRVCQSTCPSRRCECQGRNKTSCASVIVSFQKKAFKSITITVHQQLKTNKSFRYFVAFGF